MTNSLQTQKAYIKKISRQGELKHKQIGSLDLICYPKVYRGGTDSELMIEQMEINEGDTVLDLCTGNGVIALAAYKKGAKEVFGTDLNPEAIINANENNKRLGCNVTFIEGDLFAALNKKFDVILINPPFTDKKAADLTEICFWDEGNLVTQHFFRDLDRYLKPNGRAYIAWGGFADQKILNNLAKKYNREINLLATRIGRTGLRFDVYSVS